MVVLPKTPLKERISLPCEQLASSSGTGGDGRASTGPLWLGAGEPWVKGRPRGAPRDTPGLRVVGAGGRVWPGQGGTSRPTLSGPQLGGASTCMRASWHCSTYCRGWGVCCSAWTSSRGSGAWGLQGVYLVGAWEVGGRVSTHWGHGEVWSQHRAGRPCADLSSPQLCRCHNLPVLQLLCSAHLRGFPPGLLWVSLWPPAPPRGC